MNVTNYSIELTKWLDTKNVISGLVESKEVTDDSFNRVVFTFTAVPIVSQDDEVLDWKNIASDLNVNYLDSIIKIVNRNKKLCAIELNSNVYCLELGNVDYILNTFFSVTFINCFIRLGNVPSNPNTTVTLSTCKVVLDTPNSGFDTSSFKSIQTDFSGKSSIIRFIAKNLEMNSCTFENMQVVALNRGDVQSESLTISDCNVSYNRKTLKALLTIGGFKNVTICNNNFFRGNNALFNITNCNNATIMDNKFAELTCYSEMKPYGTFNAVDNVNIHGCSNVISLADGEVLSNKMTIPAYFKITNARTIQMNGFVNDKSIYGALIKLIRLQYFDIVNLVYKNCTGVYELFDTAVGADDNIFVLRNLKIDNCKFKNISKNAITAKELILVANSKSLFADHNIDLISSAITFRSHLLMGTEIDVNLTIQDSDDAAQVKFQDANVKVKNINVSGGKFVAIDSRLYAETLAAPVGISYTSTAGVIKKVTSDSISGDFPVNIGGVI